jgi:phage baseplate assembly protein W
VEINTCVINYRENKVMPLFTGFSTKNTNAINHQLEDKDLVIEDLMNHIMTRKGERVMLPTYGSIIHDMMFEPLTEETTELIEEDLIDIVNDDPRCSFVSVDITDSDHTVNAMLRLKILPTGEPVELSIDLARE